MITPTQSVRGGLAVLVAAAAIGTPIALATVANAAGAGAASSPAFVAAGFCAGKPDGDYPEPGLNTAFYTCRGGQTFNLPCPWGDTFYPPFVNRLPDANSYPDPCYPATTGSA